MGWVYRWPSGAGARGFWCLGASYNAIVKETPSNGTYTQSPVASGFTYIVGVAVDGSGNVYIADQGGKAVYKETLSSGTYTQSTVVSGLNGPSAVAVDAVGNVYIVDSGGILYKAAPSSGSYAITQVASGASYVAVDPSGNVYYSTQGYGTGIIYKETASGRGYIQTVVASGLDYVDSLVADGNGNLYAGGFDEGYGLTKLDLLDPPALGFANTVYGTISTDSPQAVTVSNLGNENLAFSQVSYPLDFPEVPGIAGDCTGSTSLAAAKSCTLTIDFAPLADLGGAASAALSENASVATNTLNTTATEQQIGLSGSELQATPTVTLTASANPGSVGNPVTFTATVAGVGDGAIPDGTVTFSYSSPVGSGTNVSTNEVPVVEVEGPGLLDVAVWRNPGSITIHLVNLTNPMAMKGPYRDFFPIGPHTVKLALPGDLHAKQARLLVADKSIDLSRSGTQLAVRLPSILDHEVVAIDL